MIFVIQGFAGSGKTTLRNALLEQHDVLHKTVGYTTRLAKPGEVDGVDYHFVSDEEFDSNPNLFLKRFIGKNKYGLDNECMDNKILILDDDGAKELECSGVPDISYIYLTPPWDELIRRLDDRGDDTFDIKFRLAEDEKSISFPNRDSLIIISEGGIKAVLDQASKFVNNKIPSSSVRVEVASSNNHLPTTSYGIAQ